MQLYGEPLAKELNLLLIIVNVVCPILRKVVELLALVLDGMVPLSQVEELCQLASHEARR
jgi:hypothetical protein